ncbi:MAG: filamentous hemagglutinin N-terminal domain-containing protein [Candidatus Omnitrophica bacterium]|nr:filamentous hemagglutinin N-terminal domain-containing protein [Candidatus Omnitrophota bacterium]
MSKKPSKFIALLISLVLIFQPVIGYSLPEGWEVQFGNANFDYDTLNQILNIFMSSDRLITNWESFSIALNEIVNFFMPSADSIALNRVVGMDPSQILGHLNSNGKIFLINPNGILFGSNSRVDTAGLVASTLNITNEDFLAGRFTFFGQGGSVVNQGYINTPGGYAVLLGSNVENAGIIEANLGSVVLAAGQRITLNLDPQGLISVVVDEAVTQNLTGAQDAVKNTGRITADGGRVILTAKALDGVFNRAINNEGVIEARSLINRRGEVYLLAGGENSVVANTGTIDVSAKESGANGGFVELSGGQLDFVNGIINTGETGEVVFDPWNFYIGDLVEWFLQHLSGSATIKARNNIYTILGDFGGDDILNLYNFVSGRTFTLQAGNSIYLNNDSIVTQGGNIRLLADAAGDYGWPWGWVNSDGQGDIYLGTGGGLNSNGGNISLSGVNVNLTALVNAGAGNVDINATDKIIDDDDSGATDVIANRLFITSVNGIGSGNALETQINQLSAYNSTLGDISISNIGPLELVALAELGLDLSIYNEGAGNVNISANSPLTVNSGVQADNGNINLAALTGNLNINANIYSSLGNISLEAYNIFLNDGIVSADNGSIGLSAGNNIDIGNGSIETVAGNINLEADNDITFSGVGQVASGSGDISLLAGNNIGLGYVSTSGNVSATAVNGAISDNNSDIVNIIASNLYLTAANGIGSADALETQVGLLAAHNTNSGNIQIDNHSSNLFIQSIINDGDDVTVANSGDILLGQIRADGSTVNLTSGGAITDDYMTEAALLDIIAANANITAADGIGSNHALDTQISTLNALNTNSHNIRINNHGNLFAQNVENQNGNIALITSGDLTLGKIKAVGNTVDLTAGGAILDDDSIFETAVPDIIAAYANLRAGSGIGYAGHAIETQIGALTAYTDAGDIFIDNLGDLIALSVIARSGDVNLKVHSNLYVDYIQGNHVTLTSNGGIYEYGDDSLADIVGESISLAAADGIGKDTNSLDIDLGSGKLTLDTSSGTGSIFIDETNGDLILDDAHFAVYTGAGAQYIKLTNRGGGFNITGDVYIPVSDWLFLETTSPGTDIYFDGGSLRSTGNSSTMSLISAGRIYRNPLFGGNINIYAAGVGLKAVNGIDLALSVASLGAVNTGSGDINIVNDRALDISSGAVWGIGGLFNANGNINLATNGNLTLSYSGWPYNTTVYGQNVRLTANGGAIIDGNGGNSNIIANNLILSAANGIGSGDALETDVRNLQATNTNSGNIEIANTGSLNLTDFSSSGYSIKNNGSGLVNISTSSPLTVSSAVLAGGNINLSAGGGNTGNLFINADVQSSGGNVSLSADNNILINDGTISSAALLDLLAGGGIVQTGGTIGSGIESINLTANNDIILSDVEGNDVDIWSKLGSISDSGTTSITANDLALRANTGINLRTAVSRLFAHNQTSGDINITNTGALELFDLLGLGYGMNNAGTGNINLTTDQNLDITDAVLTHNGDVNINTGGDINIHQFINAGGNGSSTGNIFLNSGGSILGFGGNLHLISAADTHLTAANVVGDPSTPLMVSVGKDLYLSMGNAFGSAFGSVGLLGVSGTLGGSIGGNFVFVPGTYAFNPFFAGNPPGYIFFNSSEIWPNLSLGNIFNILASGTMNNPRLYLEFLQNYRFVSFDSSTPNFYFYHPSTPSDTVAFDDITLDADAYDFIDGNLNLKKKDVLSPYYEEQQNEEGKASL